MHDPPLQSCSVKLGQLKSEPVRYDERSCNSRANMSSNVENLAEDLSSQCNTNNCTPNRDDVSLLTGPKENERSATGAAQQSEGRGKETSAEVQEKANSIVDSDDALIVVYEVRSVTISSNACLVASLHFTAVCLFQMIVKEQQGRAGSKKKFAQMMAAAIKKVSTINACDLPRACCLSEENKVILFCPSLANHCCRRHVQRASLQYSPIHSIYSIALSALQQHY